MKLELKDNTIWFDPRTKIFIMFVTVFAATMAPNTLYIFGLTCLIAVFALFCGMYKLAIFGMVGYTFFYLLTVVTLSYAGAITQNIMMAFLGLVHKVYPCGFMGAIIIKSTRINEFLSAMNKLKLPKNITITLSIMLRYIPTIQEDWNFIKDAMKLRDVSPSLWGGIKQPMLTIECIYSPMLLAASKAADELTIAAVTRGIETPIPRTCFTQIKFRLQDIIVSVCFITYFIMGQLL